MQIAASARQPVRDDVADSFEDAFERVRRRLTAICVVIAGADEAPDLVHETYLRASQRIHQLRDPALFDAWVVRIALNEAKTVLRKRSRLGQPLRETPENPAPSPDVGLRLLVQQLPPRQRAVIVLHYAYGYQMGEIARLLDLSEINVRTLAFRARRRLRTQLQEESP